MRLNDSGYNALHEREGLRLKPYLDTRGMPTIAMGNTFYLSGKKVTMKDKPITKETALWMLKTTANMFAKDVDTLVTSNINQNQFNALVSFAFNLGSDIDADSIPEGLGDSNLLKKVNANPKDPAIAKEFMKWINANGSPNKGLMKRRAEEVKIYFK